MSKKWLNDLQEKVANCWQWHSPALQIAIFLAGIPRESDMAMREIRVVLSAADPTGEHPDADEVVKTLAVGVSPYRTYGQDTDGNAVGVEVFTLSSDGFVRESKPRRRETDWEAFEKAIDDALIAFAEWLSRISLSNMDALRSKGLDVYVLVNLEIDCDQMDFHLPYQLSSEMGRLRLRLWMLSNE